MRVLWLLALIAGCGGKDRADSVAVAAVGPTTGSTAAGATTPGLMTGVATGTPTGTGTNTSVDALPPATWEVSGSWSAWSSPQVVDLDGDGVLDVVTGHGSESPADPLQTLGEVRAHSGVDGSLLWRHEARQEVFASARFVHLGGGPEPDAVLGGRHGELVALDGGSGAVLWEWPLDVVASRADGWFNWYTAATVGDRDSDGFVDLLLANGGDSLAQPGDARPPGQLAVLSGATGAVLGRATTPDGAETYCSPRVLGERVFFGTGGETETGGLYAATVAEVLAGDLSGAELLVGGGTKGVIGPPALADLTGDGNEDLVVLTYEATVTAVDGVSGAVLWTEALAGHESHSMPILAQLDGDGVPDVLVSANAGVFPLFTGATHVALSGVDGTTLWDEAFGDYASSGGVAVDRDGDGLDAVIFGVNHGTLGGAMQWQLHQFDPATDARTELAPAFPRSGVSSPWVGDLDGDGLLELVVVTADLGQGGTWRLARYDLDDSVPASITTAHYVGGMAPGVP